MFVDSGRFTLHRNGAGTSIYFVLQIDNKRIGCMKIDNELLFLQELIRVKPQERTIDEIFERLPKGFVTKFHFDVEKICNVIVLIFRMLNEN